MRSLAQAFTVLMVMQVAGYHCAPGAVSTFSSRTPAVETTDLSKACAITSSPVIFNGTNVISSYQCGSSSSYLGVVTPSRAYTLRTTSTTGQHFAPPLAVGDTEYILGYTAGGGTDFEMCKIHLAPNGDHDIHAYHGQGFAMSTPSYSEPHMQAFFAIGDGVKSVHLETGAEVWSHPESGVVHISNVVFLEGLTQGSYVYYITEQPNGAPYINKATVWKPATGAAPQMVHDPVTEKLAALSAPVQRVINPCGVTAAPGEHFQLSSVQFGTDANGPLRGMFMYGNYDPPAGSKFNNPNFVVCRFSHHNVSKMEMSWGFSDAYTFLGVTGGDNATFFNVYNKDTKGYEIIVLNQTTKVRNHIKTRNIGDQFNNPVIMYGTSDFNRSQAASPRLIIQQSAKASNGIEVAGYDTWHGYSKASWWTNSFACVNTPLVVTGRYNLEYGYCNDDDQATAFDYNGTVLWAQGGSYSPTTNPVMMAAEHSVIFQSTFSIFGYSFAAAHPGATPEDKGTAGKVVLAFFLIVLFVGIFAGAGYYVWKNNLLAGAKRTALPEHEGFEGGAGYGSVSADTEDV